MNRNIIKTKALSISFLRILLITYAFVSACLQHCNAQKFELVSSDRKVSIVYDTECKLDSIAANLLAQDIKKVTGCLPIVKTHIVKGNVILIGSIKSKLISSLKDKSLTTELNNKWECYSFKNIMSPVDKKARAFVIAGSDFRGTAYGVFELSNRIGVTPWYWWADATPKPQKYLSINIANYVSSPPSVKFRGIFLNDEDWGLQPWAAKTFEPETGDIGPNTYSKIFELLLRLKANLIWPAMHPSTKPFYTYPGNIQAAKDYGIVVGSSHAEPMLRNNVGEWHVKTMGDFNYITNKQNVQEYWRARVKESKGLDAIYTIGMRGIHDSGIEGVNTPQETVPLLGRIFADQREMLTQYINPDITKVNQAFTAYKEVLDVYDAGLKVPDDVTLVWPDDNYGYISRLNDVRESHRPGGAGVYYHVSYWGRPHDYIWLSSTSPALIEEEMTKAYQTNDRNLWVVNVGDIKPAEYDMQLFLDIAYNIKPFQQKTYLKTHLKNWIGANISKDHADKIAEITTRCYQLAFERRPEFMGWSQTEPTTDIGFTAYNHSNYGDQAAKRISDYINLEKEVKKLRHLIDPAKQDCFYQLVYYPVVSAALMNKKFLYRDKAYLYGTEGRNSATAYDSLSTAAYNEIVKETEFYNTSLSNGKWHGMMSMHPRDLPVFEAPKAKAVITQQSNYFNLRTEGDNFDSLKRTLTLPEFDKANILGHFFDLYLSGSGAKCDYHISTEQNWIKLSSSFGTLSKTGLNSEQRVWVTIDWNKAPHQLNPEGWIKVQAGNTNFDIKVRCVQPDMQYNNDGFFESNGYISIYAKNYQLQRNNEKTSWLPVTSGSATGNSVEALPIDDSNPPGKELSSEWLKNQPYLEYHFVTRTKRSAIIQVYSLPTHPLNRDFGLRYAISIDDNPPATVNFETFGRSEEWKQAVLSNVIMRSVTTPKLASGRHTLRIYKIDPGVILDRIVIDMGGLKPFYGIMAESAFFTKKQ